MPLEWQEDHLDRDVASREIALREGLMKIPERLLLAQARGKVLFVCGAGVSRPAGLPLFRGLVKMVYESLDPPVHAVLDELDRRRDSDWRASCGGLNEVQTAEVGRFSAEEYDVALGMLERRIDGGATPSSQVRTTVCEILKSKGSRPAPIHRALIRLANRGDAVSIVTTNFDRLLEQAGARLRPRPAARSLGAIPRPTERSEFSGVFHIHGVLPSNDRHVADLVVSDQDLGDFYLRRRVVPDFIYDAARLYHLVLVGYSANDPPMRYLLNAVAADGLHFGDIKERFVFVGQKSPDPVALAEWRGRSITPVPYDSTNRHAQLLSSLQGWARVSPFNGGRVSVEREVRRIARENSAAASEASRDLFAHLFRRASAEERTRLTRVIKGVEADPGWLDVILKVTRERVGGQ